MKVGFIGVGIMGKPMVRNLMKAGHELHIYSRNREKVSDVQSEGAMFHPSVSDCVKNSDAIITMVGFPKDVEEVYFGENGIFSAANAGMYLIDMTTNSPALAKRIYEEGKKRGIHVLDAPVTGGETGAISGELSILVGGEEEDFKSCLALFSAMGSNINYQGPAGNGQHAKMANQIMIAGTMAGICEAMHYASSAGLDLNTVLKSVATGAAGSRQLDLFGQKIIDKDYAPSFILKHFVKDMKIAKEESVGRGIELDVLNTVLSHYRELEEAGDGDLGTQALAKYYEK